MAENMVTSSCFQINWVNSLFSVTFPEEEMPEKGSDCLGLGHIFHGLGNGRLIQLGYQFCPQGQEELEFVTARPPQTLKVSQGR